MQGQKSTKSDLQVILDVLGGIDRLNVDDCLSGAIDRTGCLKGEECSPPPCNLLDERDSAVTTKLTHLVRRPLRDTAVSCIGVIQTGCNDEMLTKIPDFQTPCMLVSEFL